MRSGSEVQGRGGGFVKGAQAAPLQGSVVPCHSFTHALSMCMSQQALEQQGVDVVASLAASQEYGVQFVGGEEAGAQGESRHERLRQELVHVKRRANHEDFGPTAMAPLLVLVQGLQAFFSQFHGHGHGQASVLSQVGMAWVLGKGR